MNMEPYFCELCTIRQIRTIDVGYNRQKYCLPCSKNLRKEKSKLEAELKRKSQPIEFGECKYCKKQFEKKVPYQKECFSPKCVSDKLVQQEQQRWLNKKPPHKQKTIFFNNKKPEDFMEV